jgi:two-component system cell cycle response regulator DivK
MKKILVVDDQQLDVIAISAVLKSKGYDCVAALHVEDAINILSDSNDIGIVLLDMVMPEKNGHKLLPIIKSKFDVPVIAVTAEVIYWDRETCLSEGAVDYFTKPLDIEELLPVLAKYCT